MKKNNETKEVDEVNFANKQNKYIVKWQDIVTYEVEVEAHNKDEAQDLALGNYSSDNEVDCDYWEGSMEIEQIEKEQD